jgi:hypothetical protein
MPDVAQLDPMLDETPDFSLMLGGPIFQLFRKAHLSGPTLELVRLRVLVIVAITWLPLLILSAMAGHLLRGPGLPFLRDIETHVRFLVTVPILIVAELVIHKRNRVIVKAFVDRGLVPREEIPRFRATIDKAIRLRNSIPLELGLMVFVWTVGSWIWRSKVALGAASWYALPAAGKLHLTLPGYWYAYAAVPIAQFIVLRWYMRLLIWTYLLWRISTLKLRLFPAHPDRAGGLGFLGRTTYAFGPLLFAQGALLSGIIASRIFYQGESLLSFKVNIFVLVAFFVLVVLGPLLVFSPQLAAAKRRGLNEYGGLATTYVKDFDNKWVRGDGDGDALLGTGDIQSLADLGNSFAVVRDMRMVPFVLDDVTKLVVSTAAPLAPLLLTIMPLEELVQRLIKIIF